jgi:tellurite resistance protein
MVKCDKNFMGTAVQTSYTDEQIFAWLRGLLTVAWADGTYDAEEQELIAQLTQELSLSQTITDFPTISAEELAIAFKGDLHLGENFLRTCVLVAVADGVYSTPEATLLHQFTDALGLQVEALQSLEHTLYKPAESSVETTSSIMPSEDGDRHVDLLTPVKDWLDKMEIQDPRVAKFVCKMVPPQCPFERDIVLFGRKIVHIPPLCKINPLYDQLVGLRFRSLSYLADDCQEDISEYI